MICGSKGNPMYVPRALVTGASGHIGSAIAEELARVGYGVVVGYHENQGRAEEVAGLVKDLGQPARTIRLDVRSRESVVQARDTLARDGWRPSGLVNNAGIADHCDFMKISDEGWNRVIETNLYGAFVVTQTFLPDLLKAPVGRVVNIGSLGGQIGGVNQVHYAVAKAGLIGLTKSISRLYSGNCFSANCVSPGPVESPMMMAEQKFVGAKAANRMSTTSSLASPSQVGSLVAFLMTSAASHISGQDIGVNGGTIVL